MFVFAAELDYVPLDLASVLELHVSINQPAIAAEGLDAQEARATFVSGHGRSGIEAYVYLRMFSSNRGLVYRWYNRIEKADYPDVQQGAIEFTESMGFMMEDMQFRRLPPEEQQRLADETGIFKPLAAAPAEPPPAEAADARELAGMDMGPALIPDETVLDLSLDAPSTQVGYAPDQTPQPGGENPLEDKNFKVFLRLLTSV